MVQSFFEVFDALAVQFFRPLARMSTLRQKLDFTNQASVINFVAFQSAWFAAVLGAARGMPWLGVVAVSLALALHLAISPGRKGEIRIAMAAAAMGFCVDSALVATGVFTPVPYVFPRQFSSLWMVMLWVNLATTLNASMAWLRGRYLLAAVFGAIGGPMAYYSGARLGGMTRPPGTEGLVWIGIAWTLAMPLLFGIAKRCAGQRVNQRLSLRRSTR